MKKCRWIAVLLCIVIIAGTFAGCSSIHADALEPMNSTKALELKQKIEEAKTLDATYMTGLNEFAFNMFDELADNENVFLSPYSISMALSMLYNGADANTRVEMAELLGYQLLKDFTKEYSEVSNAYMNSNSKYLIDILQQADPKVVISIANSIWLAESETFRDTMESALLAPVRNYYDGDIFQVDFTLEKTLKDVNNWVSDKTEGMIDPFLEQFNDPANLRLFLLNAIYFNGEWSIPFSPDDTRKSIFRGLGTVTSVDMMHLYEEDYRYLNIGGIQGVEIPYGDENIVMDVLMPIDKDNTSIGDLYAELSNEDVSQFLEQLDASNKVELGTLAIPKFAMEYGTVNLKEALQALGMEDAFNEGSADFNLLNDNLVVSSVAHKAKIEVEEWGTKASAATGIDVNTTSALVDEPLTFIADVPFVFFIRDKQTDAILFMGQMNQIE